MDEETLKALKASIQHWENNSTPGKEEGIGGANCPLCSVFISNPDCKGCPIAEHTGKDMCSGTPYYAAANLWSCDRYFGDKPQLPEFHEAAKEELEFLKSLLPENAK